MIPASPPTPPIVIHTLQYPTCPTHHHHHYSTHPFHLTYITICFYLTTHPTSVPYVFHPPTSHHHPLLSSYPTPLPPPPFLPAPRHLPPHEDYEQWTSASEGGAPVESKHPQGNQFVNN
ncbi:hypothetical protein E2C01_057062 [Portunus trituberculatus]|uniref:Uncharacterized protein n=1 Tax=Portunus trituberculatus TaxID=210409 RepID=A0A5B7GSG8_PORTR|nr:hypothetical protein [Portunus trituberculatus]